MDSSLRAAAQQALEALEDMLGWQSLAPQTIQESAKGRAAALKAALVEDAMQKFTDVNQELEAALADPVQEPVAWSHINGTSDTKWHPPQRKPLTEEEIAELARQEQFLLVCDGLEELTEIARAIERAHGIGGQP